MSPLRHVFNVRAVLGVALVALLWLGGCGGGDETVGGSTATTTNPPSSAASGQDQERAQGKQASSGESDRPGEESRQRPHPSRAGAAEFETPGGDNSLQRFGAESQADELAQAEATLHDYLEARTTGEWGRLCKALSSRAADAISSYAGGSPALDEQGKNCVKVVGRLFPPLPESAAREATVVGTAALRVNGNRGVLLFRGAGGIRYFVAVARENGSWKLAAPAPTLLP